MSWSSFWGAYQRLESEERYTEQIHRVFTRGPECARSGTSDYRRRLAILLRKFRALEAIVIGLSSPPEAITLLRVRVRELEGYTSISIQAQSLLEETICELRDLYPHPTPSSTLDRQQGLGGSGTLESGRPLPPQPPVPPSSRNPRIESGRKRPHSAEHSSSSSRAPAPIEIPEVEPSEPAAAVEEAESDNEVVILEEPAAEPTTLLVCLDWHKTLSKSYRQSRSFLDQIAALQSPNLRIVFRILSYSGYARGRESRAEARQHFEDVPFYRCNNPGDKPEWVEWLCWHTSSSRALHIDDRADIIAAVNARGGQIAGLDLHIGTALDSLVGRVSHWVRTGHLEQ